MEFYNEMGISSSWANQSEEARQAKTNRKRDKQYRNAAQRRQSHPELPYNPENPYDTPFASAEHMLSILSSIGRQPDPLPLDDSISELSESDTIEVDTRSTYSGYMPPPSNYTQGQLLRKRRQSQTSINSIIDTQGVESRVKALREQIRTKKKEQELQALLRVEKELQIELANLSS